MDISKEIINAINNLDNIDRYKEENENMRYL